MIVGLVVLHQIPARRASSAPASWWLLVSVPRTGARSSPVPAEVG
jgi:hypothetical protein